MTKARRAFTIVEMVITFTIMSAILLLVAQLVSGSATQRRQAQRRSLALQEVSNLMEQVFATPWDKLTSEALEELELTDSFRRYCPTARLNASLQSSDEHGSEKTVRLEIITTDAGGSQVPLARLAAMRYARVEEAP